MANSIPIRTILLMVAFLVTPLDAQRHLPLTNIFESPGLLLLDTRVESPAIYSGGRVASLPRSGDKVELQIFAPRQAGRQIFEYNLHFRNATTGQNAPFTVVSVKDWEDYEQVAAGRGSPAFSASRVAFAPLPRTGHICTVVLEPVGSTVSPDPLDVRLTITTVSTPPRRVNRIVSRQQLTWL